MKAQYKRMHGLGCLQKPLFKGAWTTFELVKVTLKIKTPWTIHTILRKKKYTVTLRQLSVAKQREQTLH